VVAPRARVVQRQVGRRLLLVEERGLRHVLDFAPQQIVMGRVRVALGPYIVVVDGVALSRIELASGVGVDLGVFPSLQRPVAIELRASGRQIRLRDRNRNQRLGFILRQGIASSARLESCDRPGGFLGSVACRDGRGLPRDSARSRRPCTGPSDGARGIRRR
jgi:hypothetical protein